MTNQIRYRAPKWAIELWEVYRFFDERFRDENRYGVFRAGSLALESVFNCTSDESTGFFYSKLEPIESDSFGIVKPEFKVGDCVKNVSSGYAREFGPRGAVEYGVVTGMDGSGLYVQWDGCDSPYLCYPEDVEHYTRD